MSAKKKVQLDDDVREILRKSTFDGTTLILPGATLPRPLYERVNKAIEAMGGKWNRKARGHVFDYDPRENLAQGVAQGQVRHLKNEFNFFPTPPDLADRLVEYAQIEPNRADAILEPSAGDGAIARRIAVANPRAFLHMVELDPRHLDKLREVPGCVHHADFLEWKVMGLKAFDRVIANPPFSDGRDLQHVMRMCEMIKPGGLVVSVVSRNALDKASKVTAQFKTMFDRHSGVVMEEVERGAFGESGTDVPALVIRLEKPRD